MATIFSASPPTMALYTVNLMVRSLDSPFSVVAFRTMVFSPTLVGVPVTLEPSSFIPSAMVVAVQATAPTPPSDLRLKVADVPLMISLTASAQDTDRGWPTFILIHW